jgi:dipeptidyl aminopeptidase/acylaminoacyl peptidase
MSLRRLTRSAPAWLLTAVFVAAGFAQTAKRPLTHKDFDGWRAITSQRLSPDGKWLAYGLFPQEGDGEIVIRNLATGQEARQPAGARPQPAMPAAGEETAPEARSATVTFSADSRTLVFSTFPAKADTDKAKKDKKPADQMPKDGMVIYDLAAGKATRIERVKRFALPEKGNGVLAYLKEAAEAKPETPAAAPKPEGGDSDQQRGGRGGASTNGAARTETGADLVLRALADGAERTFTDVTEFSLTDDATQLLYVVSAKDAAKNGLFATLTAGSASPAALLEGKGKYLKLTWDENQTKLAFVSDRDDAAAKQPKFKVYQWNRQGAAVEAVTVDTPGFNKALVVSERANLSFSKDGARLFFAVAPPAAEKKEDTTPDDEKASVDLWHWKDDYIQSIQKVRAERDRNRSYVAVYLAAEKRVTQLADATMADVSTSESSQWALGSDDREYRPLTDWDERYADAYLVDLSTGARKLITKKNRGSFSWSPGGKYLLNFDGKDWFSTSVPDGKTVNLTAKLPVKFWNELEDTPSTPSSYGVAGWIKDGSAALLYDRYDIWRFAPDGSSATNITNGYGRKQNLRFRYVRLETDPRERWIDPAKPLLLSAESQSNYETGYFRASLTGGDPAKLVMANRYYAAPVKAKDADAFVLTGQSFTEFPDLLTTDSSFKELRKVSAANPQQSQFTWGSAELLAFKNSDGVALNAALYKPDNFDPKKKYPMLVYIYERLADQVNRYVIPRPSQNINISYYVSNGYLVLTPDIAYTTGYPGQSALKCVLPAIQAVVDRGYVDEKAIGIQGHSWGGYQIAYMVTQTNRFRAAAAGAPVSNMISAYDGIRWGTGVPRQFQYERTQSRIGGSIWQYPTRFMENSPIFWADRVQTPLMLLHNDGDDAVPWYQGIEYYLALRRLQKEVYLFVYNGEPHGLRRRADQKDYAIRLQQYFDHFLKGAPAPDWMEKGVPYLEKDRTALSVMNAQ